MTLIHQQLPDATTSLTYQVVTRKQATPRVARQSKTQVHDHAVVWFTRLLCFAPFVFIGPELFEGILGRSTGIVDLSTSGNDVLGTAGLMVFMLMLAVTPIFTVTGWQRHRVLRRDLGRAMFAIAFLDLILAATTTANRIPGGLAARLGGHAFLFFGTLSTLLVVPLMLTSNKQSQRWLGHHWKTLHKLTYVAWVTILIHLAFLFGLRTFFLDAVILSVPLFVLRLPGIERRWSTARQAHSRRLLRAIAATALLAVFVVGFIPFATELAHVGVGAFVLRPPN